MFAFKKSLLILTAVFTLVTQGCSHQQPQPVPAQSTELASSTAQATPISPQQSSPEVTQSETHELVKTLVYMMTGGELSVSTSAGDTIQLIIPAFSLQQDTEVILTAHAAPLDGPFKTNFFAGITIEPEGLSLRRPATLTITSPSHEFIPGERIFYLKSPEIAIPLWQSDFIDHGLSGKISHFSNYIGGSPSGEEAQSQAAASSQLGNDFPGEPGGSLEGNQAMGEWGKVLNDMGLGDTGDSMLGEAGKILEEWMQCLVSPGCMPVPEDPCGEYQTMVLMYYDQALRLGFDPESSLMKSMSELVDKVLNECTNRYTLVYNHNLSFNQMGIQQDNQVTGEVVFTAPIYGAGDLGPIKMNGSGTVAVTISGTMDKDDETCTFSGSGKNLVTINGELVSDEMGNISISLDVGEQWYTESILTVVCPDDEPTSQSLPPLPEQHFTLEFPYHDGAQITQPNVGGLTGTYNWTLRIIHSW